MCLLRVQEEQPVPYRVVSRRSHHSSYSPPRSRVSRTVIEAPTTVSHHSHIEKTRISSPPAKVIPPPQPVPVFVKPEIAPPPPPPPPAPAAPPKPPSPPPVHYVEVSPSSSHDSVSESEYIVREHEIRRERTAEYSPARSSFTDRSPRYETFRYIEPPDDHHHHHHQHRSRERSMSRDRRSYHDDPRGSYRSTRIEVNSSRRPREYWR